MVGVGVGVVGDGENVGDGVRVGVDVGVKHSATGIGSDSHTPTMNRINTAAHPPQKLSRVLLRLTVRSEEAAAVKHPTKTTIRATCASVKL